MSYLHNNQLNSVSLFDDDHLVMGNDHSKYLPLNQHMTDYYGALQHQPEDNNGSHIHRDGRHAHGHDTGNALRGNDIPTNGARHGVGAGATTPAIKVEGDGHGSDHSVSYSPTFSSEDGESDFGAGRSSRVPSRTPKINKDGAPRKPRQPRPKLLKWTDNDWKNVVLGIIWACGETGVTIRFDQAAQVVGEHCTAGAMQQAILKLRQKQIDQGYDIPSLRMAWTRKNKTSSSPSSSTNAKIARPSLIVRLKLKTTSDVKTPSPPPETPVNNEFFMSDAMFGMGQEAFGGAFFDGYGDVFDGQDDEFGF